MIPTVHRSSTFIFLRFTILLILMSVEILAEEIQNSDDLELERQIEALDNYIYTEMITKKPNRTAPPSDVPDMSVLAQLFETAADRIKSSGICFGCKVGVGLLMSKVRVLKFNASQIGDVASFACDLFRIATPDVCTGIIERYGPVFSYIFKEKPQLTSRTFCGVLLQSYGCTTGAGDVGWTVNIPPPKTIEQNAQFHVPKRSKPRFSAEFQNRKINNTGRIKFIQLSDLHIDPFYEAGAEAECDNNILCCQGSQGRPLDESLQAGYHGDLRKCDLPYSTLEITLKHIAEQHADAQYFYMTGDVVPHNIWSTTRADNSKTIHKVAGMILKHFPNMKVLPVLGNHEPHPVNFFSPRGVPEELSSNWIYEVTYDAYKQWIPSNQAHSYLEYGFYAMEVNENFKILVLNTNFCYEFNVWQMYKSEDTGQQLEWLVNHLQEAEMKNQSVHIVGHVPPGHDECFHVFSKNFYNIILRYYRNVKGQFYGHTHYSEFKLFHDLDHRPINTLWISPSVTPYEVNNVAYRIYFADPSNYEIMDHETWVFDLKEANKNASNEIQWFKLYSGSEAYGLPDVTPESMGTLIEKLATDSSVFKKFYKHYLKYLDDDEGTPCNTHCRKRLLCSLVRSYHGEDKNCYRVQKKVDGLALPMAVLREIPQ